MNEKRKRELMYKFATENRGEWPEGATHLLTTGDGWRHGEDSIGSVEPRAYLHGNYDSLCGNYFSAIGDEDWVVLCSHSEYLELVEDFHARAPKDAQFYSAPTEEDFEAWYKCDGEKWMIYCPDGDIYAWDEIVEKVNPKSLIPLKNRINVVELYEESLEKLDKHIKDNTVPSFVAHSYMPSVNERCQVKFLDNDEPQWFDIKFVAIADGRLVFIDLEENELMWSPSDRFVFKSINGDDRKALIEIINSCNLSSGVLADAILSAGFSTK